jgi:hemin uptake protein HemP
MTTIATDQRYQRCVVITQSPTEQARVNSSELLGESGKLTIEHMQQEYTLRITRTGKLIMTK